MALEAFGSRAHSSDSNACAPALRGCSRRAATARCMKAFATCFRSAPACAMRAHIEGRSARVRWRPADARSPALLHASHGLAYHGVMHRRADASRCPGHGVALEECCCGCGAAVRCRLNAKLLGAPFRCANCWRAHAGWRGWRSWPGWPCEGGVPSRRQRDDGMPAHRLHDAHQTLKESTMSISLPAFLVFKRAASGIAACGTALFDRCLGPASGHQRFRHRHFAVRTLSPTTARSICR